MIYTRLAQYYDMFIDDELIDEYLKIVQHTKKDGAVLDLGTGTGPLAIALAKEGFYVTATDISEEMLSVAYNNALEEDVHVNFFLHDILDTVNRDYDIICMSNDVINYIEQDTNIIKVFQNVSLAMNSESIFIFDFLRVPYLEKMDGHHEEILLYDDLLKWSVVKTNIPNQIKHTVEIGTSVEHHILTTYLQKDYLHYLKEASLYVIKKVRLEDRIIFVCKKEI